MKKGGPGYPQLGAQSFREKARLAPRKCEKRYLGNTPWYQIYQKFSRTSRAIVILLEFTQLNEGIDRDPRRIEISATSVLVHRTWHALFEKYCKWTGQTPSNKLALSDKCRQDFLTYSTRLANSTYQEMRLNEAIREYFTAISIVGVF